MMSNTTPNTPIRDGEEPDENLDEGAAHEKIENELLREENERLREEFRRAITSQYRRTAVGFAVLGFLAAIVGVLLPSVRSILFALSGIGLFTALLVYYLTPERVVSQTVLLQSLQAYTDNLEAIRAELGLRSIPVYIPRSSADDVRLFLPAAEEYTHPDSQVLDSIFVVDEHAARRGVSFQPVGERLYDEFEDSRPRTAVSESPEERAQSLADGLVEVFELVDRAVPTVEDGTVRFTVEGGLATHQMNLDHPIPSFLGVGVARQQMTPVSVRVRPDKDSTHIVCTPRSES